MTKKILLSTNSVWSGLPKKLTHRIWPSNAKTKTGFLLSYSQRRPHLETGTYFASRQGSLPRAHTIQTGCSEHLKSHKPFNKLIKVMSRKMHIHAISIPFSGVHRFLQESLSYRPGLHLVRNARLGTPGLDYIQSNQNQKCPGTEIYLASHIKMSALLIPAYSQDGVPRAADNAIFSYQKP